MTGAWSSGKGRKYPYYSCPNRACRVNLTKAALEDSFVDLLDELRPPPGYMKLFKAVVYDVWKKRRDEAGSVVDAPQRRIRDTQQKLDRLMHAIVDGAVDRQLYDRERERLGAELAALRVRMNDATTEELDVEEVLSYADSLAMNVGRTWRVANPTNRLRLQRFVMPEGLVRAKDGTLRNVRLGRFFKQLQAVPRVGELDGAGNGIRTRDFDLGKVALYH